ncbi:ATP-binding cassette domain-containing protein [uncultured Pseudokineococcus sp.]|uniref:ATP-binding cassette domain-containing protein n=1 Tax=uncultured Pseudokineococcus sp. TaxID=1642928 RepID=UPI0026289A45|nr:ATP-binding cassette domain-containing protein [uncultured Pseudokineococcus sp.]
MGHVELNRVSLALPDGRPLLHEVSFRVGEGSTTALVGPNGVGKTTLLRVVAGGVIPDAGAVTRSGGLAVLSQDVGRAGPGPGGEQRVVRDLLVETSPARLCDALLELDAAELAVMEVDDEPSQMRYAQALVDAGEAGAYEVEVAWDALTRAALGIPYERCRWRSLAELSGGQAKRLAVEALLRGPDEVLVLDEPDNSLDVPAKRWLEAALSSSPKTVLFVSHDRELLARTASSVVALEPGPRGAVAWVHGAGFGTWHAAREARTARLEELRRRWDEEHVQLRALVVSLRQRATFNDGMSSRYQAALTRLARFEEEGPPPEPPQQRALRLRLRGGRTGRRAVVLDQLAVPDLLLPADAEIWFGDRVALLGPNGSGKSSLLRLLAAGGTEPGPEHAPATSDVPVEPVPHTGTARLGARVVPGWFSQRHRGPEVPGREAGGRGPTLLEVLHRGDGARAGLGREGASRALDRYGLAGAAEQTAAELSGGQRARFRVLLLELSGATLLLLDEPTDDLDLESAEALESALADFEGTVVAVTHDRWFARGFDRFLVLGADGRLVEVAEPVWEPLPAR